MLPWGAHPARFLLFALSPLFPFPGLWWVWSGEPENGSNDYALFKNQFACHSERSEECHAGLGVRNTTRYAASNPGVRRAPLVEFSQRGRLSDCFHWGRGHLLRVTLLLPAQLPHSRRPTSGFALVRRAFHYGRYGRCGRCGAASRLNRRDEDTAATVVRRDPLFLQRAPRPYIVFRRQN